jgi:nucleoside-diphosphate kinase
MIKPNAVKRGYIGPILGIITEAGFKIIAMKLTKLSMEQAKAFYKVHEGKPFYDELSIFMSSGPIVAAILEKDKAVEEYRKLIGSTDPAKASDGTIRKLYAESMQKNAVHGADSDENAHEESLFFFSAFEIFEH